MGEFAIGVAKFAQRTKQDLRTVVKGIVVEAFSSVVLMTPVDKGRARANWQVSVNVPASGTTEAVDPTGGEVLAKIKALDVQLGNTYFLTNNLPYAGTLEYGGYPVPVKKGTYVKGVGYVIKSEGGFSKQAPAGMVRVTMARIQTIVEDAKAGAKL